MSGHPCKTSGLCGQQVGEAFVEAGIWAPESLLKEASLETLKQNSQANTLSYLTPLLSSGGTNGGLCRVWMRRGTWMWMCYCVWPWVPKTKSYSELPSVLHPITCAFLTFWKVPWEKKKQKTKHRSQLLLFLKVVTNPKRSCFLG